MGALWTVIGDSWRDALARKAAIIVALLVLVPLLLLLLGLQVEPGSTPDTVRAKMFGTELGTFFFYEERGEVSRHLRPVEIPRDRVVQVVSVLVLGFVDSWGILLALFLTAGLLPRTLVKGYAELILSKPVPRWSVYLGRYAGGVSLFAGACLVVALAVEGILAGKTGLFTGRLILASLVVVVLFAALFAVAALAGVLAERSGIAILSSVLLWLFAGFLARVHEHYPNLVQSPKVWVRILSGLAEALYRALPRTSDLSEIGWRVVVGEALGSVEPLGSTVLFTLGLLALSLWLFSRRDF